MGYVWIEKRRSSNLYSSLKNWIDLSNRSTQSATALTEEFYSLWIGILKTDHGEIKTPIFMPVGTAGTVKSVSQRDLEDQVNAQIILGNTYYYNYSNLCAKILLK